MRAVIQRVAEAKVSISGAVKGAIQQGLAVLLAVEEADTAEDIEWLSGKIVRLRVFDDDNGVMNRSVQEVVDCAIQEDVQVLTRVEYNHRTGRNAFTMKGLDDTVSDSFLLVGGKPGSLNRDQWHFNSYKRGDFNFI